ncbi:MAG: 6,7-dimethyl-8-ribityllumazine synthase, partial [Pseudomonadota bacterium]
GRSSTTNVQGNGSVGFSGTANKLIVASPYYGKISNDLLTGARATLEAAGASHETVLVPGALEIPTAIRLAAKRYEGFVALGCVIRGETTHYETVCNDSSRGLTLLGLDGLCIGNGILTCENMDQAAVRAAPDDQNKGGGAAAAALHLIALARRFKAADRPVPPPSGDEDILLAGAALPGRTA